jgi:hypothetical protein
MMSIGVLLRKARPVSAKSARNKDGPPSTKGQLLTNGKSGMQTPSGPKAHFF